MFKNLNRTLAFFVLLIGTCSAVFAVDFSQALSQSNEQVAWIDSIFQWKATVSNLYSKALKIAKDKEVSSTTVSFGQLKNYFSTCIAVKDSDFTNILYYIKPAFRNTFLQILPSGTKFPTTAQIDASYNKFFTCRKILTPTANDVASLNNEILTLYDDIYDNAYTISTLNKFNFGSDLFWNGTLDDSEFDLLYDINQVGKILFDSFTDTPEFLFYRLPKVKTPATQNGSALSSLWDQSSYQLGAWGWYAPTSWAPLDTVSSNGWLPSSSVASLSLDTITTDSSNTISALDDKEVKNLIEKTNPNISSIPAGAALSFWNQCLVSDTPTPAVEEKPTLMTPEEYLSGIDNFIQNANIDEVINNNLLSEFKKNNPLPLGWSTSDSWYADAIANTYAEKAFGWAPGSCEYNCTSLPLDKQAQCELSCAKSCIQKCDGLWLQDKLLCASDCTCFLIAWPNGKWWEKMEDMFRIKFCKVPVQTPVVQPWKKVFSIQGIFQEISDVLQWLRDSGQMVKYSKRKEFLDGNIKIKLADNFAFKLQVWFKPVFPQISTTVKAQEQSQANVDLNIAVLDMNTSAPEADDYNKYIVIADVASNKATMEPAWSLAELNQNIDNFATAVSASKSAKIESNSIAPILTTYAQNTDIIFVQNMIEFLTDNQLFLNNLSDALLDMNKMSLEFKTKIENSN